MRARGPAAAAGEQVHLTTREHGVVLVPAFARATVAVAAFGAVSLLTPRIDAPLVVRAAPVAVAALLVARALARLLAAVGRWHGRRLFITDRHAVLVSGPLGRRSRALPLDAVEEVEVVRGALGRALGYGTVVVRVRGHDVPLLGAGPLPEPLAVFDLLLDLAGGAGAGALETPPAPPLPAW